jgi:hypothetical protein
VATRPGNNVGFLEGRALRRRGMVGEAVAPSTGCLGARAVAAGALARGIVRGQCAALGGGSRRRCCCGVVWELAWMRRSNHCTVDGEPESGDEVRTEVGTVLIEGFCERVLGAVRRGRVGWSVI